MTSQQLFEIGTHPSLKLGPVTKIYNSFVTCSEEWGSAASELQQWTSHLEMFNYEPSSDVLTTPKCRDLVRCVVILKKKGGGCFMYFKVKFTYDLHIFLPSFRRLELSKGDVNLTEKIREDIVNSEVPFSSVSFLFSLQPTSYPILSQYLIQKLDEAKESKRYVKISLICYYA